MRMSRRLFFKGLTGKEGPRRRVDRAAAIDAYVRTNLLPYDFCLTDSQVEELLRAVRSEFTEGEGSELSPEERRRITVSAQETIEFWRDEYLKAEDKRRDAAILVREFLHTEATPDLLEGLRNHFQIPATKIVEDEIERSAVSWLYALPNAHLAPLNAEELRNLVFTQIQAWGR
jgi:hypothetical protein